MTSIMADLSDFLQQETVLLFRILVIGDVLQMDDFLGAAMACFVCHIDRFVGG